MLASCVIADMPVRHSNSFASLMFDSWSLAADASTVIGLRIAKMAAMDAAAITEMQRMVIEKAEAAAALQARAITGGMSAQPDRAARQILSHYRKKVRANKRRLSK